MPVPFLVKDSGHRLVNRSGFTLIELLAVIAIIAVLAALTLSISAGAKNRASVDRARSELAVLGTALEEYRRIYYDYPEGKDGVALLAALTGNGTRPPFFDLGAFTLNEEGTALVDPWDNPYVYVSESLGVRQGYRLFSLGPDGGREIDEKEGVNMDLDNVTATR